jgi:autotransporter-associated beta strand protein
MKKILLALAFVASASIAMAAVTPVSSITVSDSPILRDLQDVTSGGVTYTRNQLSAGTTTSVTGGVTTNIYPNVDDPLILSTIVAGVGQSPYALPVRTVLFAGTNFTSTGSALDFFIFEAGAGSGDAISVAPIFLDGTVGTVSTNIPGNSSGWGNTGITIGGPVQGSQFIQGTSFSITDLKDNSGNPLPASATIQGIAITAGAGVDVAGIYAVVPLSPIDHFGVTTTASSPQLVGVAFNVTITAQDINNVTVNSGGTVVTVTSPGGSLMEFDWNSDGTYGDKSGTLVAGVKTIKARNKKAETATIVASAGGPTTPTPPSVTTTEDVFSKLQVLAPGETAAPGTATGKAGAPTSHLAGTPFNFTVNAVDQYWNLISAAPGDTIAITSTDNTATLPADAPLVAGTQVFPITFNQRGSLTITATNTSNALFTNGVSASIVSSVSLVWQGDGSVNLWNTNSALNWSNLLFGVTYYANGDEVTFDSVGSSTPAVNIVGIVTPSALTVNSANNYTLGSTTSGGIGGPARLTKSGAGTLTLSTSNSYTGGSSFSDGVVILTNANALPTSGTLAMTNSMLVLAANSLTRASITVGGPIAGFAAVGANRSVSLGNITWGNATFFSGSVTDVLVLGRATDSFTLDFQSQIDFGTGGNRIIQVDNGAAAVDAVISGRIQDNSATPGNLIKTGAGTLQLSHPTSNYEGVTEVQDGTVILTGGMNSGNAFILGNGATSGVLQLGNASTNKNLVVGSLTASGTGTANAVVGGNASVSVLTINNSLSDETFTGVLGGAGANQNSLALTKNGITVLTISSSNTYSGATTISGGTLALTGRGSINNSLTIDVTANGNFEVTGVTGGYVLDTPQTLNGSGNVTGNVTAKGRITPGSGIGTLYFFNSLAISGPNATVVMEIDAAQSPNSDSIYVGGTFTPGGRLVVTNLGTKESLTLGTVFQLFSQPVSGSFSSIVYPQTPSGMVFTNKLAENGSIELVVGVLPPTPTNITYSVSGGNLILDWPAGQGWQLQSQANPLTVGVSTNWVNVPGAVPPFTNAVNSASGAVFYRLVYP